MNGTVPGLSVAIIAAGAFLALLPAIIVASSGRLALQIAALLLCFLSIGALLLGSIAGLASSGLSFVVVMPVAAALWFGGLFCAIAAWIDQAHERRSKEMTLRLLMNETRGLGHPQDYMPRKLWWGN